MKMSTQQNIDDMSDEEFIAYLISIGRIEVVTEYDGKVRYVETELSPPPREEIQQALDELVAEGKLKEVHGPGWQGPLYLCEFVQ